MHIICLFVLLLFLMLLLLNRLHHDININLYALGNFKNDLTHFIVMFALLQWSGTKPTVSLVMPAYSYNGILLGHKN